MLLPTSAGACVFNHNGEVLLIKVQSPGTKKIYWSIPKGEIEKGEDPKQTAIREVFEETGVRCNILRKVSEIEIYRQFKNTKFHKKVILYAAFANTVKTNPGSEVLDARFIPLYKAIVELKQHDMDYLQPLLKSLFIVAKKYPQYFRVYT